MTDLRALAEDRDLAIALLQDEEDCGDPTCLDHCILVKPAAYLKRLDRLAALEKVAEAAREALDAAGLNPENPTDYPALRAALDEVKP